MNRVELRDRFIDTYTVQTLPVVQQDIEDAWESFISKHFIDGSITLEQLYRWIGKSSCITLEYLDKRLHETVVHRNNREQHRARYKSLYWKKHYKETT